MNVLVTGSSGLIGSEAVLHFDAAGHSVFGIDNNMRMEFFGAQGDTRWNRERLKANAKGFTHAEIDIRDYAALEALFEQQRFEVVVHCAAQPSHDRARDIPLVDFAVNATGTLNLLEAARRHCPECVFLHMSTNKVYGDAPNEIPLVELTTRWEYARPEDYNGIPETLRIDRSLHSIFGASKVAADVMAQEYGRSYGLKVGIFRGGCLTGPAHSGVELHGFLSYMIKAAIEGIPYRIFGYKGKQVRDQIHSRDVVALFDAFIASPQPGGVYNLGGGRLNSASLIECIEMVEDSTGLRINTSYVDSPRRGDHICYISDLTNTKKQFPIWTVSVGLSQMVDEMVAAARERSLS